MNDRKRVAEEWIATDTDNRGNPRSFAIVEHEPQQPTVIDNGLPIVSPLPPMVPRITSHIEGTPEGRARAFGMETLQLSLVVGGLAVIMA